VKNQDAIGNAQNLNAPNQNASLYAKIQIVNQKLHAVDVMGLLWDKLQSFSSKKPKKIQHVVHAIIDLKIY